MYAVYKQVATAFLTSPWGDSDGLVVHRTAEPLTSGDVAKLEREMTWDRASGNTLE